MYSRDLNASCRLRTKMLLKHVHRTCHVFTPTSWRRFWDERLNMNHVIKQWHLIDATHSRATDLNANRKKQIQRKTSFRDTLQPFRLLYWFFYSMLFAVFIHSYIRSFFHWNLHFIRQCVRVCVCVRVNRNPIHLWREKKNSINKSVA